MTSNIYKSRQFLQPAHFFILWQPIQKFREKRKLSLTASCGSCTSSDIRRQIPAPVYWSYISGALTLEAASFDVCSSYLHWRRLLQGILHSKRYIQQLFCFNMVPDIHHDALGTAVLANIWFVFLRKYTSSLRWSSRSVGLWLTMMKCTKSPSTLSRRGSWTKTVIWLKTIEFWLTVSDDGEPSWYRAYISLKRSIKILRRRICVGKHVASSSVRGCVSITATVQIQGKLTAS